MRAQVRSCVMVCVHVFRLSCLCISIFGCAQSCLFGTFVETLARVVFWCIKLQNCTSGPRIKGHFSCPYFVHILAISIRFRSWASFSGEPILLNCLQMICNEQPLLQM